jgi:hypothetical protein
MTTTNESRLLAVVAASDLSAQATRYRAITLAGALVGAVAAGAADRAIGILITSTRSGENASAVYDGLTKAMAGAAVSTLGYPVMVGSQGYIFAATSGGPHIGRAIETANSGDLFKVLVNFSNIALWTGA